MRLDYRLTEEDYIRYNEYHLKHSPTVQRNTMLWYLFAPAIYGLVFFTMNVPIGLRMGGFLLATGIWLCIAPSLRKRRTQKSLKSLTREGDNTNIFGRHVLTISPEGLTAATETSNSEVKWRGISKVAAGEHGVYLYSSAHSAYLIPNSAFDAVNTRERFLEEVLRYREQAAGLIETV